MAVVCQSSASARAGGSEGRQATFPGEVNFGQGGACSRYPMDRSSESSAAPRRIGPVSATSAPASRCHAKRRDETGSASENPSERSVNSPSDVRMARNTAASRLKNSLISK